MATELSQLQGELRSLKLDDSLLFLNHILNVSRGFAHDVELARVINASRRPVLPHIVHFLAKQLILETSNFGTTVMDWETYQRTSAMCVDLDDPICNDPDWKHADPSGFFERMLSQQLMPQEMNMVQKLGLGLGLYRDTGVVAGRDQYDLRREVEAELRMTIDDFALMGFLTLALRWAHRGTDGCMGTFRSESLIAAFVQGLTFCVPENWTPFLERVATDRNGFRLKATEEIYRISDPLFEPFAFNPLRRFPILRIGGDRLIAVDPLLIVDRVTSGLFYDLLGKGGEKFTVAFGGVFECFVGQLLCSACDERIWSATSFEVSSKGRKRPAGKVVDWAYRGDSATVLLECKAHRPKIELVTHGTERSLEDLATRIARAVTQLSGHASSIAAGLWTSAGLAPAPCVGIVVTYGKYFTVNGPPMQRRVWELLEIDGVKPIPYVVLSLDDLDSVMSLVESGIALDVLVAKLASDDQTFSPLRRFYSDELTKNSVSSFTMRKARELLDRIPKPDRPQSVASC